MDSWFELLISDLWALNYKEVQGGSVDIQENRVGVIAGLKMTH